MLEVDWQDQNSIWAAHPTNHRLVPGGSEYGRYLWVRDQIAPGSRVLDVGCNCGQLAVNLTRDLGCEVVGVDIVLDFIRHCKVHKKEWGAFYCLDFSRVSVRQLPACGLHYQSFDVVTALEVIEHAIDIRGFLERAVFVLKPGGRLIVTTPHPASPTYGYPYYRRHAHHVRVWTPWRLEQVFGPMAVYKELVNDGEVTQMGVVFERLPHHADVELRAGICPSRVVGRELYQISGSMGHR